MRRLSAQEILRRAGIPYVVNARGGKYTTTCPKCRGKYLNVKIDGDGACWICRDCDWSGPEPGAQGNGGAAGGDGGGGGNGGLGAPVVVYDYADEHGERLFQVLKFEPPGRPKTFRQRRSPDQVKWSIEGVRLVPFMLHELLADVAQEHVVFVVEGEKDVLTLRRHGIPATCNPMGAGKWWESFNDFFRGADVVLCGDNDAPGREHIALVARNLKGVARRLRVLELASIWPGIKASDDISDWFDHGGGTAEVLWAAVERLPDGAGDGKAASTGGASVQARQAPANDDDERRLFEEARREFADEDDGKPQADDDIKVNAGGGEGETSTLADTLAVFDKWLVLPDKTPVLAVLGAVWSAPQGLDRIRRQF